MRRLTIKKKNNKKKINGRVVKSEFEWEVYERLKSILPKGATIEYEVDKIPYIIKHTYTPDFTITFKDGRKVYIEAKGAGRQFDGAVRQKMVAVRDQNPELDLRIIFYRDAKIGPVRKDNTFLKQSDWGTKNKFTFSVREYLEEWFK